MFLTIITYFKDSKQNGQAFGTCLYVLVKLLLDQPLDCLALTLMPWQPHKPELQSQVLLSQIEACCKGAGRSIIDVITN